MRMNWYYNQLRSIKKTETLKNMQQLYSALRSITGKREEIRDPKGLDEKYNVNKAIYDLERYFSSQKIRTLIGVCYRITLVKQKQNKSQVKEQMARDDLVKFEGWDYYRDRAVNTEGRPDTLKFLTCKSTMKLAVVFHDLWEYIELLKNWKQVEALGDPHIAVLSEKCPICMESLCQRTLECAHSFCDSCITEWFTTSEKSTCPQCMEEYDSPNSGIESSFRTPNINDSVVKTSQHVRKIKEILGLHSLDEFQDFCLV